MTDDLETRLRAALPDLVPPWPPDLDLATGARSYARRATLRRGVAVGTTLAVVVVAGAAVARSQPDSHAPVTPTPVTTQGLESVDHTYNCLRASTPPTAVTDRSGFRDGAMLARICPVGTTALSPRLRAVAGASVDGGGWSPPSDALVTGLNALAQRVNTTGVPIAAGVNCPARGGVRTFALTFQYPDGSLQTVQGSTDGCDAFGSPQLGVRSGASAVLDAFSHALLAQRALMKPHLPGAMYSGCPERSDQAQPSGLSLPPRTPLVHAVVCDYAAGFGRWAGILSRHQLGELNADLWAGLHGSAARVRGGCARGTGLPARLVLGYDAWGDFMTLRGSPCWGYRAEPSGLLWQPTPAVAMMLDAVTVAP